MPDFLVTGPDEKIYTITGPEGSTREQALERAPILFAQGKLRPREPEGPWLPEQPPSFSSMTEQAGVGLYTTGTGLAALPGEAARFAESVGGELPSPFHALTQLPSQKDIEQFLEPYTGPVPSPRNIEEEYARTFGEFLPLAGGGAKTLLQRVGRVLFPTVVGETAKQAVKKGGGAETEQELAKFVGAITPSTLSYLWRTAPDRMEMVIKQLYAFGRGNYKHPDVTSLVIKTPAAQTEAFRIADELFNKYGMRGGPVADAINELAFPKQLPSLEREPEVARVLGLSREGVNYDDISRVRDRLSAIGQDFTSPHDQMLANVAQARIDSWMTGLTQDDVLAGNAKAATSRLSDARSDWWAAKSLEQLGDKIYVGERQAAGAHSGQNLENAVRQRINSILKRERQFPSGQFTPKEIKLMERAGEPRGLEQLARRVSRLFPRHGAMAPLVGFITGTAVGHPAEGALAGFTIGEAAGTIENKLANAVLKDVQKEILGRAASGGKVTLPPRKTLIDLFAPGVLARPPEQQKQQRSETQSQRLTFDALGNLVTSAEAKQAPVLGQLPEAAARVERERKRREAEVE